MLIEAQAPCYKAGSQLGDLRINEPEPSIFM